MMQKSCKKTNCQLTDEGAEALAAVVFVVVIVVGVVFWLMGKPY